jgi:hypothetical protein
VERVAGEDEVGRVARVLVGEEARFDDRHVSMPASATFLRTTAVVAGETSTAITRWHRAARARANTPVPHPRSTTVDPPSNP